MYIIIAILMFGLLIAIHEFGHFITAKGLGVKVNEFAIGMGPAIFKRQRGETLYALRILPIGGYCAMEGEDEDSDDPRGFHNQALWKRLIILCAGSFMNFLIGFAFLFMTFLGRQVALPVLTDFMENCPYESADALQVGDEFYEIDGHRIYFTSNISRFLERGGSTHDITVIRDGERVTIEDLTITKLAYEGETEPKYGFYYSERSTGFLNMLKYSWYCSLDFVREVWLALSDLVAGAVGVDQLSGPVGIVSMVNDVGEASATFGEAMLNIVYFEAFIAINLAVMNMLPIPALDGGRVLFALVGAFAGLFTKKKLNPKFEGYLNGACLLLLFGLMFYVMYNDIVRIIS